MSDDYADRYAASLMNTFGPPKLVLARGEGAHVWDVEGKEYVDFLGGIAVNALGHAHPALVAAVTTQLQTLGHVSNFFTTAPQIELAEKLLDLVGVGPGGGKVFFANSGTEANEAAFKLTRRTGRTHVVVAEGSFHGRTMGALALTSKQAYRTPFEPLPGDVTFVPYGDAAALANAVTDETAAILLEPIQGEAGVVVPPDGYLAQARTVADDHGALLWLDEVQSGMGRTGAWFAHRTAVEEVAPQPVGTAVEEVAPQSVGTAVEEVAQQSVRTAVEEVAPQSVGTAVEEVAPQPVGTAVEEVAQQPSRNPVRPDIVTLAKGLGGGFPIGACIGLGRAGELFEPGNHGTTFGGNPVACAAALAVIRTIEDDKLLQQVTVLGQQLRDGLRADPRVTEVRGAGLFIGLDLAADRSSEVVAAAQDAGFILNNPTPRRIRLVPPLVITPEDVNAFLAAWPGILDRAFTKEQS